MATDTTVSNLIINVLSKAQYEALENKSDTELYLVPDEIDTVPTNLSNNPITSGAVFVGLQGKQPLLVSGTNIKTINSTSLLGSGDISVGTVTSVTVNGTNHTPTNGVVDLGTITSGGGGGDTNVIEAVKVNGTALTVDSNKAVDITAVPASIITLDATHRFVTDTEKSTWNGKASDSSVVHTSGNESISGIKTFSDKVQIGGSVSNNITTDENDDYLIINSGEGVKFDNEVYVEGASVRALSFQKVGGTSSQFLKADGSSDDNVYLTTETDPTVPAWAKAATKPAYTAAEVGALPDTTVVPTESTVSGWGFTKNTGTIMGITMNGSSKGTSGVVDLGTVITSHQDISGKANNNAVVHLSGDENISGNKAFADNVTIDGGNLLIDAASAIKYSAAGTETDMRSGFAFLHSLTSLGEVDIVPFLVPRATASNNGKMAVVDGDKWSFVTPVKIYTGSSAPSSATGNDGDIYIQTS